MSLLWGCRITFSFLRQLSLPSKEFPSWLFAHSPLCLHNNNKPGQWTKYNPARIKLHVVTEAIWQPLVPSHSSPPPHTLLSTLYQRWSSAGPDSSQPVSPAEKLHGKGKPFWRVSCIDSDKLYGWPRGGCRKPEERNVWGSQMTSWEIIPFTNNISLLLQDTVWLTQLLIFCLIFPPFSPHFFFSATVIYFVSFLAAEHLRQGSSLLGVYRAISRKRDRSCAN